MKKIESAVFSDEWVVVDDEFYPRWLPGASSWNSMDWGAADWGSECGAQLCVKGDEFSFEHVEFEMCSSELKWT